MTFATINHGTETKACTKCGEAKPLSEYEKCKTGADGLRGDCKACRRDARIERRERRTEAQVAADREKSRRYLEANHERSAKVSAAWREANREELYARQAAWRAANPHVGWAKNYRRRARNCGVDIVEEHFTKPDLIERYGDACFYCGGEFQELDHYVPISDGGPHVLDNVRPSCIKCNANKRATPGHEWEERHA